MTVTSGSAGVREVRIGVGALNVAFAGDSTLPPLLLLHGLGSTHRIWDLCVPLLADSYHLVIPDQRGHGWSVKPESGYGFEELTTDAVELLDALGMKEALVMGHSWGGDVALELAVRHPDRIVAVGLVDGGIIDFRAHMTWPEAERMLEPQDVTGLTLEELKDAIEPWLRSLPMPEQNAAILANYEDVGDGTYRPHLPYGPNMAIAYALWAHRPPELYERLQVPAFVVQAVPAAPRSEVSERFYWWRSHCVSLAEQSGKATVHRFVDSVHDVPLQRPHELVRCWAEFRTNL